MSVDTANWAEPVVMQIQGMLRKIDHLHLPQASRRDLESILVRQVSKELDRALPWQAGHGRGTEIVALRIGQAVSPDADFLHQLKLAALLHDIGIIMLPPDLQTDRERTRARLVRGHSKPSAARSNVA